MPPLRFVILRHDGIETPHFDCMFETSPGSDLLSFRSPIWPLAMGTELASLGDHRRAYLDYEGPVSNNRGHVRRVLSGTCELAVAPAFPARQWIKLLEPLRLSVQLENVVGPGNQATDAWRVVDLSA